MTVSVINNYIVSDEGEIVAQGFIGGNEPTTGYHLKQSLIWACKLRGIQNYKILSFHHGQEFGLAAVMSPAGNVVVN